MSDYKYPYIKEEGNLYIPTSNRAGKKFQTWSFTPVNGKRFDIEIDLMYPSKGKPLRFSASSAHLTRTYESSDIENLRQMVDADLQESCAIFNNIVWEEWYEVVVGSGYKKDGENKSVMSISYGKLKRGIHPKTGEPVTIHNNKVILPFPKPKTAGKRDEKDWSSNFSEGDEVSYVPATKKNTKALETLVMKLSMLRNEVSNFLSQDNVEETLKLNLQTKLISHD